MARATTRRPESTGRKHSTHCAAPRNVEAKLRRILPHGTPVNERRGTQLKEIDHTKARAGAAAVAAWRRKRIQGWYYLEHCGEYMCCHAIITSDSWAILRGQHPSLRRGKHFADRVDCRSHRACSLPDSAGLLFARHTACVACSATPATTQSLPNSARIEIVARCRRWMPCMAR